jgi:GntR family histidine utilization transcriptional repressor
MKLAPVSSPGRSRPRASRATAMALYEQVKEYITRHIQSGEWPPGHRLPSEHELSTQFGISRMTANRALRELMDQGRIVRVAGVGSFVAESKPQSTLLQIANIANEIRGRGHDYGFQLISAERVAASPDVAAWMGVRMGESVFHCVCLHLENEMPVQLEDRYVNPRVVPEFLQQDFGTMSPSEYLVRNVPFDEIEHLVDAVLPTPEQAERLDMDPAEPCLQLTRRTWVRGQTITLVRCLHPASRYRLGCRLRPNGHPESA